MQTQTANYPTSQKRPFEISEMLRRIEEAVTPYPKAMLFELYERGYTKPFEQLVACMISIRTLDETSLRVALALFAVARTPFEISRLALDDLDKILRPSTYHYQKAERIQRIAKFVHQRYNGELPCEERTLIALPGVGAKTANLVLGIACGKPKIAVDIHVERVTNRWGYVNGASAGATEMQLERKLPREYWVTLNRLLVPFGKHICTSKRPKCSTCPVLQFCRQVGVVNPR